MSWEIQCDAKFEECKCNCNPSTCQATSPDDPCFIGCALRHLECINYGPDTPTKKEKLLPKDLGQILNNLWNNVMSTSLFECHSSPSVPFKLVASDIQLLIETITDGYTVPIDFTNPGVALAYPASQVCQNGLKSDLYCTVIYPLVRNTASKVNMDNIFNILTDTILNITEGIPTGPSGEAFKDLTRYVDYLRSVSPKYIHTLPIAIERYIECLNVYRRNLRKDSKGKHIHRRKDLSKRLKSLSLEMTISFEVFRVLVAGNLSLNQSFITLTPESLIVITDKVIESFETLADVFGKVFRKQSFNRVSQFQQHVNTLASNVYSTWNVLYTYRSS